jgi:hypothetical protein
MDQKKAYAPEPEVFATNIMVTLFNGGMLRTLTPPPPVPV